MWVWPPLPSTTCAAPTTRHSVGVTLQLMSPSLLINVRWPATIRPHVQALSLTKRFVEAQGPSVDSMNIHTKLIHMTMHELMIQTLWQPLPLPYTLQVLPLVAEITFHGLLCISHWLQACDTLILHLRLTPCPGKFVEHLSQLRDSEWTVYWWCKQLLFVKSHGLPTAGLNSSTVISVRPPSWKVTLTKSGL